MNRFFCLITAFASGAFLLYSCGKDSGVLPESGNGEFVLFASCMDTKTTNDELSTKWEDSDGITVIHALAGETTYTYDGKFSIANADLGQFTGTLASDLEDGKSYDWYAVYPNNGNAKKPDGTTSHSPDIGCQWNKSQTQTGNSSMAHLAGKKFPLVGNVKNVPASEYPSITMRQAASVVAYRITNGLDKELTVRSVVLTSAQKLVGAFKIDYTGDELKYSAGNSSTTATLNVTDGTAIAAGSSALFYAGIVPHTEASGATITVAVTVTDGTTDDSGAEVTSTQTFTHTFTEDVTFSPGKIKTFELTFNQSF